MADLQLAISEAVVRKLFVTARDNFAFSHSDSVDLGPFTVSYSAGVKLKNGDIDFQSNNTVLLKELDIVYDPLSVTFGLDIPRVCVGGFLHHPNAVRLRSAGAARLLLRGRSGRRRDDQPLGHHHDRDLRYLRHDTALRAEARRNAGPLDRARERRQQRMAPAPRARLARHRPDRRRRYGRQPHRPADRRPRRRRPLAFARLGARHRQGDPARCHQHHPDDPRHRRRHRRMALEPLQRQPRPVQLRRRRGSEILRRQVRPIRLPGSLPDAAGRNVRARAAARARVDQHRAAGDHRHRYRTRPRDEPGA